MTSDEATPPVIGNKIILLDQVASTNALLKEYALQGADEGLVVMAAEQTAGRGRGAHTWSSPRSLGLYLSLLLRPGLPAEQCGLLSILLTLAVVKAIRSTTKLSASIKWPNDIMFGGRKVSGILVENHIVGHMVAFTVAGIGININQKIDDFPNDLQLVSTSLRLAAGRFVDRDEVATALLRQMNSLYPHLGSTKMRQKWVNAWQQYCQHMHQPVSITRGAEHFNGMFMGVNQQGAALVTLETSETIELESGAVTLREK